MSGGASSVDPHRLPAAGVRDCRSTTGGVRRAPLEERQDGREQIVAGLGEHVGVTGPLTRFAIGLLDQDADVDELTQPL